MAMDSTRHSCLRLDLIGEDPKAKDVIFVKGTWYNSHFDLSITDGLHSWTCQALEAEVRNRAEQWDQPVTEYVEMAERYLGFQHPGSVYRFEDAGNGQRRLSFTFEKQGTKLEWRWKCQRSPDDKQTTSAILDFLMDANIRLSEEVVRKTHSFERVKLEAQKCLEQSERLAKEKTEFESAVYSKFVAVLNSKKAKLRELRDRLSKSETPAEHPVDEVGLTDETESFDEKTDDEESKPEISSELPSKSKNSTASNLKGQKRKLRR